MVHEAFEDRSLNTKSVYFGLTEIFVQVFQVVSGCQLFTYYRVSENSNLSADRNQNYP